MKTMLVVLSAAVKRIVLCSQCEMSCVRGASNGMVPSGTPRASTTMPISGGLGGAGVGGGIASSYRYRVTGRKSGRPVCLLHVLLHFSELGWRFRSKSGEV